MITLFCSQIRSRDDVLVDANRTVDFAATAEQAAEREMRFDGLVVDPNHLQEVLQGLIGLFVEQEVQAFQIVDIERLWCLNFVTLAETAQRPAQRRQQQEQPCEQECRFSRHQSVAGF